DLEPADEGTTLVRHTYDWTQLSDETRFPRALATTRSTLMASVDRLAALAEEPAEGSTEARSRG
ncbi:MAG: polyketide cyclase, partial [Citricoccus sp.]|nr:polyketide cyclase [Citricoccus sp. WCRC_4]